MPADAITPPSGGNLSPATPGLTAPVAGGNLAPTAPATLVANGAAGSPAAPGVKTPVSGGNLAPTAPASLVANAAPGSPAAPGQTVGNSSGNVGPAAPGQKAANSAGNVSPAAPGRVTPTYTGIPVNPPEVIQPSNPVGGDLTQERIQGAITNKSGFRTFLDVPVTADIPDLFKTFGFEIDLAPYSTPCREVFRALTYGNDSGVITAKVSSQSDADESVGCYVLYPYQGNTSINECQAVDGRAEIPADGGLKPVVILQPLAGTKFLVLVLEGSYTTFHPATISGFYSINIFGNQVMEKITAIGERGSIDYAFFTVFGYSKLQELDLTDFDQINVTSSAVSRIKLTNCRSEIYLENLPNLTEQVETQSGNGGFAYVSYINTGIEAFVFGTTYTYVQLSGNPSLTALDLSPITSCVSMTLSLGDTAINTDDVLNSISDANAFAGASIVINPPPTAASQAMQDALVLAGASLSWI